MIAAPIPSMGEILQRDVQEHTASNRAGGWCWAARPLEVWGDASREGAAGAGQLCPSSVSSEGESRPQK